MNAAINDTTIFGYFAGNITQKEREEVHRYFYENDSFRTEFLKMMAMLDPVHPENPHDRVP